MTAFAVVAVLVSLASLAVVAVALRAVLVARARLITARLELAALRDRTAHAEATVDAAIRQFDELRELRIADVQRMRADVREIRENFDRIAKRNAEAIAALEAPPASERVQ